MFQPLVYGPPNCLGMNLATAEIRLVATKLLQRVELAKPPGPGREWEGWMETQKVWVLWHKGSLMVGFRERKAT